MSAPRRRSAFSAAAALLLALAACSDHDPTGVSVDPDGAAPRRSEGGIAAFTGSIRIGVVPTATSVDIGSAGAFTLTDKSTGATLVTGSGGEATVALQTSAVIITKIRLQVTCSADVSARKAAAEAAGYVTFTEFVPSASCTRLYLGEFDPPPANTFAARTAFRNTAIAQGHAGTDSFYRTVTTTTGVTVYRVTYGSTSVTTQNPVVLTAADGIVTIDGVTYRGRAEVQRNGGGTLAGVNELHVEQYLYGVVPRELSPDIWPEVEALKAQAVAARTYALSGLGKRAFDGYDLLATTADQVYGGYAAEHPVSNQAVDETAGLVATHEGRLIQALFHSTSGGATANNEDVFASAPVAYLRGVRDHEHGNSEHVLDSLKRAPNAMSLRGKKNGDWEGDWSGRHRWTFSWSMDEISEVLSAWAGVDVGRVLAINVLERSNSGRVARIEYVTEAGTFTDTKDRIRSSLRFIGASGPSNLPSTLFLVEPVLDHRTGEVEGYEVFGGGFGHGVGLSQTGAVGMAEKKYGFEAILKHYYQGIELTQWY